MKRQKNIKNSNDLSKTKKEKIISTVLNILFVIAIILVYLVVPSLFASFFTNGLKIGNLAFITLISNFLTLLIVLYIFNKDIIRDFKDFKKNWKTHMKKTIKYWAIGLCVMIASNLIINVFIMGGNTISGNEEAVRELIYKSPIMMMISACIFAPIGEEIVFRLSFKPLFKNIIAFSIITGLIFGSMHLTTGFSSALDLLYIVPYGALGYAFGYAYFKTNNIFSTITMHFLHNTFTYSLILLAAKGLIQ